MTLKDQIRERSKTHFIVRMVSPLGEEIREMERTDPPKKVFGFIDADMLHGGAVYVKGATPFAGCKVVEALLGRIA